MVGECVDQVLVFLEAVDECLHLRAVLFDGDKVVFLGVFKANGKLFGSGYLTEGYDVKTKDKFYRHCMTHNNEWFGDVESEMDEDWSYHWSYKTTRFYGVASFNTYNEKITFIEDKIREAKRDILEVLKEDDD